MRILHLIDSLDYSGSARQMKLLGPALARADMTIEICALGPDTPWAQTLRQAGVTVHTLGWTRWLDVGAMWNLRDILRDSSFDLIHVWRLPALRTLALVARELLPSVVMSAPLPAKGQLAWWDRRLLERVRCLALAGFSDQERCVQEGIVRPALRVVPPAVEVGASTPATTSRLIVCVGRLERDEGFRHAIWAFDVLLQLFADAQLHLVGRGSQQPALAALSEGLMNVGNVHFLGSQADATDAIRAAEIVWAPSLANCGRQVALEAMALGRPVVAFDVPCLREVVRDGETGFLVPAGNVVELARRTRLLFGNATLRSRMGNAARRHVQQRFALADATERWRDLYRGVVENAVPLAA